MAQNSVLYQNNKIYVKSRNIVLKIRFLCYIINLATVVGSGSAYADLQYEDRREDDSNEKNERF